MSISLMERRFKFLLAALVSAAIFAAPLYAEIQEEITDSAPNAEALAMLEQRFASLSGSLGKMSQPPKLSGTLSLPPNLEGRISLPGGRENIRTQQGDK